MKTCAAEDCRKPLPPGRRRWCSEACQERIHSRRRRGTDWSAKGQRHPRTAAMWEMRAEMDAVGGKGRCIFCEGPLPKGRRLHCGSPGPDGCEADYQHMYHLGELAERPEAQRQEEPKPCANGCGGTTRMGENHRMTRFCSEDCQRQFNWMKASHARTQARQQRRIRKAA